ncbi:helix-turn-helix domain-containing protein [Nocardia sp. NPDC050630]|uniref:helix-turn-helix domain-containing protein n=1 Tax=Nocardia sp. NPDC050630 TaxID=3364321 RepID=UPI0037B90EEF
MDSTITTPIAEVVGGNLKRIRTAHGLTTDQIAVAGRRFGLNWTDSRVSAMERGKVSCTLATLVALTLTLETVLGEKISLSSLLAHEGFVELNDDYSIEGRTLSLFVANEPVEVGFFGAVEVTQQSRKAEERVAKDLNLSIAQLAAEAERLWGHGFTEERDLRAGDHANAQKRGRIARVLKDELSQAITQQKDSRHGND